MTWWRCCFLVVLLTGLCRAEQQKALANPIEKVLELFEKIEGQVKTDGENEEKAYKKYFEWCDDTSAEKANEIKMLTSQKERHEAELAEANAHVSAAEEKIEELSSEISKHSEELQEVEAIRAKEVKVFKAAEQELVESVDQLARAAGILEKQMANGGSFLQDSDISPETVQQVISVMSNIVNAEGLNLQDAQSLHAFLQTATRTDSDSDSDTGDEDSEDDHSDSMGAPAAAVYESKSGSIVEMIDDLKDKSESQLRELRENEAAARNNFNLVSQSLKDKLAFLNKQLDKQKDFKATNEEAAAVAQGHLDVTTKALEETKKALKDVRQGCIQHAADHEDSVAARAEELKVLEQAKEVVRQSTGGAADQAYSFFQLGRKRGKGKGPKKLSDAALGRYRQGVAMVQRLASAAHSAKLLQLVNALQANSRLSTFAGADPFEKVRTLITDMVEKLQTEMAKEAEEKAWCDQEMSRTTKQKTDLEEESQKLKTHIDEAAAQSGKLQGEVAELQKELGALAKSQGQLDEARRAEHEAYVVASADLKQGLEGVRSALRIIRDYYAKQEDEGAGASFLQDGGAESLGDFMRSHGTDEQPEPPTAHKKNSGGATGLISMLQLIESDLSSGLSQTETEEAESQSEYEKVTQENKVIKASKEKDVEYNTKEYKALEKQLSELGADYTSVNQELAAVSEYLIKVKDRCVAKPEQYEERKKRREAEIAGLKEALGYFKTDEAEEGTFLQRRSS
eukprot:TRINITY_DN4515_c1_g1_i1.p1 TRINITY_DN4515_c1_g1~~TRINITY_DN4515_c1_g1_i1.p1  ORF type:complete len:740 (+),score=286.02 TRINITY_DN4515_c1_g1_i1:94-2313(+)